MLLFELGFEQLPYDTYLQLVSSYQQLLTGNNLSFQFYHSGQRLAVIWPTNPNLEPGKLTEQLLAQTAFSYPLTAPKWCCFLHGEQVVPLATTIGSDRLSYVQRRPLSIISAASYLEQLAEAGAYLSLELKQACYKQEQELLSKQQLTPYKDDWQEYCYFFEGSKSYLLQLSDRYLEQPEMLQAVVQTVLTKPSLSFSVKAGKITTQFILRLPCYCQTDPQIQQNWLDFCQDKLDLAYQLIEEDAQQQDYGRLTQETFVRGYGSVQDHVDRLKQAWCSLTTILQPEEIILACQMTTWFYSSYLSSLVSRFPELAEVYSALLARRCGNLAVAELLTDYSQQGKHKLSNLLRLLRIADYLAALSHLGQLKEQNGWQLKKDPYQLRRLGKEFLTSASKLDLNYFLVLQALQVPQVVIAFLQHRVANKFGKISKLIPEVYHNNLAKLQAYQTALLTYQEVHQELQKTKARLQHFLSTYKFSLVAPADLKSNFAQQLLSFIKLTPSTSFDLQSYYQHFAPLPKKLDQLLAQQQLKLLPATEQAECLSVMSYLLDLLAAFI